MLNRREMLVRSAAAGAGVLAAANVSELFTAAAAAPERGGFGPGLGAPVPDPAGILDLPRGFRYSIVSRAGDLLPGGGVTPGSHDGTGAFRDRLFGTRLVQNHELLFGQPNPVVAGPELTYDPKVQGGTTTLALDWRNRRVDEYVSLAGTARNCAGGPTPWETWLTCEESELRAGPAIDRDHGYVFEVDPHTSENNVNPTPLTALGRFAHEAVCVDPVRADLYLTEDASGPNGLVYRFEPNDRSRTYGALRNGGALTAMRASQRGTHVPDLSVFTTPGTQLDVTWVPVPEPQAFTVSTRAQFGDNQVTRSAKLEGCWWGDATRFSRRTGRVAHIVCSFARLVDAAHGEHDGQVWAYDPESQTLTLEVYFPVNRDPASDRPDGPDNITVSPFGGLFIAEDGDGVQHLLAVDEDGTTAPFARARISDSEFAGVCFAPHAQTLFANLQADGLTFAITGPFWRSRF
jgi:uncharacterized protein